MKDQLFNLYKKWESELTRVYSANPDQNLNGPLLISPGTEYAIQANPLLIIGQETKGWSCNPDDISLQMEQYEKFNVGKAYYSSPFWNITRKVEQALGNAPYSCAWTNISKYDLNDGPAYGVLASEISKLDIILKEEISILKPNICLFYTGPYLDDRLKNIFKGIEFENKTNFTTLKIVQLKHPDLPTSSFRTYHPNYLRRSRQESEFMDFIRSIST